jgi:DNA-binding transcriptional LysR family regulator
MALDWNDLRYLLAVRRRGTLAAAAKELKVTKGTVSRRLVALEESLGVAVVERQPGGFVLTPAGKEAAATGEHVERLCEDLEERVNDARTNRAVGLVRLTAPSWLADRLVLPALPELRVRAPELEIELMGTNRILNLVRRDADIAIRNVVPEQQSLVSHRVAILGGACTRRRCTWSGEGCRRVWRTCPSTTWSRTSPWVACLGSSGSAIRNAVGGSCSARTTRRRSRRPRPPGSASRRCRVSSATRSRGLVRVPSLGFSTTPIYLVCHEQVRGAARIRTVMRFVEELFERNRGTVEGGHTRGPES